MNQKKMDPRIQHKINKINQEAHARFGKNLFTKERPMEKEYNYLKERVDVGKKALNERAKLKPENIKNIENMLKNPAYKQENSVLNEKVASKYERFIDNKIKKLVKDDS